MGTKVKHGARRRRKGLSPSDRYYREQFRLLVAQMNANNYEHEQLQEPVVEAAEHPSAEHELWQAEHLVRQAELAAWQAKCEMWRAEREAHHAEFRASMDRCTEYMNTHFPPVER